MQIASSSIQLSSSHYKLQQSSIEESLSIPGSAAGSRVGRESSENARLGSGEVEQQDSLRARATSLAQSLTLEENRQEDRFFASAQSTFAASLTSLNDTQDGLAAITNILAKLRKGLDGDDDDAMEGLDAKTYRLKSLVEAMTGKDIDLSVVRAYWEEKAKEQLNPNTIGREENTILTYEFKQKIQEKEETKFNASGVVTTEDGRKIEFNVSQLLEREYQQELDLSIQITAGELIDPLVINLENEPLQLTDDKFAFDLDVDGEQESISFVAGNSGFLAFDKNGNGQVDDGSELFGALTGDGYAELAKYDQDNNNFIDAGDDIYQHLSLWQKDASGNDSLTSVKDLGIGAFYLGNTQTPFELKDDNNQLQGAVRASSVFIKESGEVGLSHQIDLAV